jgi:hypothetical protein
MLAARRMMIAAPTSPWVVRVPQWNVAGATPFASSTANGFALIIQHGASADETTQLTVTTTGGISGAGIAFRVDPAFDFSTPSTINFWFFVIAGTHTFLYKIVANSFNQIGTWSGGAAGDVLAVVTSGASITVKRNGSTVATVTDSFNSTATDFGIYTESTAARFASFSLTP